MKRKFYFIFFILSFILILTSCKNNNYTATKYSYKLSDNITDIEINWRVGDIEITSGDEFSIVETSQDGKAIAPLNYSITSNKLVLNYNNSNKDLKIVLDNKLDYNLIQIETTNSIVTASNIVADELIINGTTGMSNLLNSRLNKLYSSFCSIDGLQQSKINNNIINTASINYERIYIFSFENNTCTNLVFNVKYSFFNFRANSFKKVKINSINCRINLTLSAYEGFTFYSLNSTSIDFETINYNNKYIYLDGSNEIECHNKYGSTYLYRKY